MTVFPPRNLPGDSEKWGRQVETTIKQLKDSSTDGSQDLSNLERSTGGQLGGTESIIDELLDRTTQVIHAPVMSATGTATSEPYPRAYQTVVFPSLPATQSGFLTFEAFVTNSDTSFYSAIVFVRHKGNRVLRLSPLPGGNSESDPVESQGIGRFEGFWRIPTLAGDPVSVDLELAKVSGGTSSTVTLSDIIVTLTRTGV